MHKFWTKHRKYLWHEHFTPSIIAGVVVAIIISFFNITISNVVLFGSVGASAFILTNVQSHHLTKLHTTIKAYILAIILSVAIYYVAKLFTLPIGVYAFILIFLISILLVLFNSVHPPAVSAALSFLIMDTNPINLLYLFVSVLVLFILVRFATYVFSQHLPVKEFMQEFKIGFLGRK